MRRPSTIQTILLLTSLLATSGTSARPLQLPRPPASLNNYPRQVEPCLAGATPHDTEFDLRSIPLIEWLAAGDATEIPWKVRVLNPELRMDQRYELIYTARFDVQNKEPSFFANREFLFVSGISDLDGRWLTPPEVGRWSSEEAPPRKFDVHFGDCIFVQPGNYVLWMVLYDPLTAKHNVLKHNVRLPQLRNDPLPDMGARLPRAEFPKFIGPPQNGVLKYTDPLVLPVGNDRPLAMELIAVMATPEQWLDQPYIVRSHYNRMLAAVATVSQMRLAHGSISMAAFDLVNQSVPFEERDFRQLDWPSLVQAFASVAGNNDKLTVEALHNVRNRSVFFRKSLEQRLGSRSEEPRVVIVLSSSLVFERGSELQPLKLDGNCNCRVYHLRFRYNKNDVFDDIQRLIKPLHPKIFNIANPRDLRKAMAEIIKDLERVRG